jgi:hypothetical protein
MATAGANKRLVRMFYKEIVEPGRTDLLETFAEADMLDHGAAAMAWRPGRNGFVQHIVGVHAGVSSIAPSTI